AKWSSIPEIANAERGIDLTQAHSCSLRVRLPPRKGTACRQYAYCRSVLRRLLRHRPFRPCGCVIIPACDEMSVCYRRLHVVGKRIERAQSHRTSNAFNRGFRLTEPDLHPTAQIPRRSRIRIERERLFNQCAAVVQMATNVGKHNSAPAQRDRVVLAQL